MKILIIEDEKKLREELAIFLVNNGYEVDAITDFTNVYNYVINGNCDLILLDIKLPNIDGRYLCKELRKKIDTPIIIVTSINTEIDELLSINYGADDFITKPYNSQILLARIERILRRMDTTSNNLKYQNIIIDLSKSSISSNNKTIELSRNEMKILSFLIKNKGHIVTRDEIISFLWDNNEYVDDNTLTVNINRLRLKLKEITSTEIIITKRGQGYLVL